VGANAFVICKLWNNLFQLIDELQGHSINRGIVVDNDGNGPVALEDKRRFVSGDAFSLYFYQATQRYGNTLYQAGLATECVTAQGRGG
jgi:hypothetical protein